MNKKLIKQLILTVLIMMFISRLIYLWMNNWTVISEKFDPKILEQKFLQSQWRVPMSENPIDDETLFEYAGWAVLYDNKSIFEINPEGPPLGKILFGFIETSFGLAKINGAIFSSLALILMVFLGKRLLNSWILSLFLGISYSFQPIFTINYFRSLLDIPLLVFLLLSFIFYSFKSVRMFLLGTLCLGAIPAIKLSIFFYPIVFAIFIIEIILRKKWQLIIFTPLLFIPLLLSYIPFFISGGTLIKLLKNQKWILNFYQQGTLPSPFYNTIMMYIVGKWQSAFPPFPVVNFPEWNLSWPIFGISIIIYLRRLISNKHAISMFMWVLICMLLFSFTYPWPRYFIIVLPIISTLFIYIVQQLAITKYPKISDYV